MNELDAATSAAAGFNDKCYAQNEPVLLELGKKLKFGSAVFPPYWRFYREGEPAVTFKDEAHALPTDFGFNSIQ